jgi:hypothetical protein
MSSAIVAAAYVVAFVAALRSTWSPCGLSMLSSITPIGERGRGHRFAGTASWFVAGALLGGLTLGAALFGLAAGVAALGPSSRILVVAAAVAAALSVSVDAGLTGIRIPVLRRQVNEVWLDQFRSWVYGAGFGWQIGVGFTTYVMTAAVVLTCALAALTARPWAALGAGVAFGAIRGLTVFLGARVTSPDRLRRAHQRLERLRRPVWLTVIATQLVVAGALMALVWWPAVVIEAGLAAAVGLIRVGALTAGGARLRRAPVVGRRLQPAPSGPGGPTQRTP